MARPVAVLVGTSLAEAVTREDREACAEAGAVVEYSKEGAGSAECWAERVAGCVGSAVKESAKLPALLRVATVLLVP